MIEKHIVGLRTALDKEREERKAAQKAVQTTQAEVEQLPTLRLQEWLRWLDPHEPHLILPSGVTLKVAPLAAVPSGKEVSILVMGGDF